MPQTDPIERMYDWVEDLSYSGPLGQVTSIMLTLPFALAGLVIGLIMMLIEPEIVTIIPGE